MPSRPDSSDPRDIADYVEARLDALEAHLRSDIAQGFRESNELFRSAFVDGDPVLHKHAHQLQIEAAAAQRDFWRDMTKKVAQGGVWAAIVGIAMTIWVYLQMRFGAGGGK